jgi:hypothetical protein
MIEGARWRVNEIQAAAEDKVAKDFGLLVATPVIGRAAFLLWPAKLSHAII